MKHEIKKGQQYLFINSCAPWSGKVLTVVKVWPKRDHNHWNIEVTLDKTVVATAHEDHLFPVREGITPDLIFLIEEFGNPEE